MILKQKLIKFIFLARTQQSYSKIKVHECVEGRFFYMTLMFFFSMRLSSLSLIYFIIINTYMKIQYKYFKQNIYNNIYIYLIYKYNKKNILQFCYFNQYLNFSRI